MASRSVICLCLWHRQIIDLLPTDKSRYFAKTELNNWFIIQPPILFFTITFLHLLKWRGAREVHASALKQCNRYLSSVNEKINILHDKLQCFVNKRCLDIKKLKMLADIRYFPALQISNLTPKHSLTCVTFNATN